MQIDTTMQQIKDLLSSDGVHKVLVTSGKNVDPDALGSALALTEALQQLGKEVTLAIEEYESSRHPFLPGIEQVQNQVGQKSLVVSIDVGQNPITKINYNTEGATFNLILTPKTGQVDVDQIQYSYAGLTFDTIITVDTAKKELLGDWANSFAAELEEIPLINIDHHADNEQFGTLNFVDPQAASCTLVVQELIRALGIQLSPSMATNLLAGLLSDTSRFANTNSSAASFRQAADLIDAGADLHGTMHGLFRTMSFTAMRLWGLVLHNLRIEEPGIIIGQLSQEDIATLGATDNDIDTLGGLANEILTADHHMQVALMLKDKGEDEISGSLRAVGDVDVAAIARQLGGGGHPKAAGFRLKQTTLDQAREQAVMVIRQALTANNKEVSGNKQAEREQAENIEQAPTGETES